MSDFARERRARRDDEDTAPFALDRPSDRTSSDRISVPGTPARAETQPVMAAVPADPSLDAEADDLAVPHDEAEAPPDDPAVPASALRLERSGRRATRLVAAALFIDALVLLALVAVSAVRISEAGAGIPDLMVGGLALVLALPCLLGAISLRRVARAAPPEGAHHFAHGIGHLRGVFVLKAAVLFTTLGLGCFAFSLIASLLALS